MALRDDQITREAKRRTEEEERRKKQAARSQTVAVPRGEVGSFTKAYQGYKFVEEGSPEARSAKNLGEFIETEAQRRFEAGSKDKFEQEQANIKAGRKKAVEKARADMRSGKTSTLVGKESLGAGKQGDQYAGVQGPLPLFKTQEEADISGESRYLIPAPPKSPRGGVAGREMVSPRGEGIEVRKPEAGVRRVFRAMVQGDPASDQLFNTKEEAEKYLKEKGLKGVVAGIAFKGKTGEEITQNEQAYRGGLQAEKTRKSDLEKLYATRKEQATERVGRIREAAADYDAATTPAQREAARGRAEAARLEGMLEEATRRMPQEQKQKVAAGLAGVLQRRGEREARVQRETQQARAESQRTAEERAASKAGVEAERIYTRLIGPMYRAAREARRQGDFGAEAYYTQMAEMQSKDVPKEVGARRRFFQSDAGKVKTQNVLDFYARQEAAAQEAARRNRNPTK